MPERTAADVVAEVRGISKIALLYNAKSGALVSSTGVSYGDSRSNRYSALLVFTWSDQDIAPEQIPRPSDDAEARAPDRPSARREP